MDIKELKKALKEQLEEGEPIDPERIKELIGRTVGDTAETYLEKRFEIMQRFTRLFINDISKYDLRGKPDILDHILKECDLYNLEALDWVNLDVCPFEDSQPFRIATQLNAYVSHAILG